jgi:Raf kinase inhibitor-like YbhB/YbcL family protein
MVDFDIFSQRAIIYKKEAKMRIKSPAFEDMDRMPERYTCDGQNVNPPLWTEDVPASAKSLALVLEDPDAPRGTFTHWVVWNIPPETREIQMGMLPEGAKQGVNDFKRSQYGGPCPPSGTHRYVFKLFALNSKLDLKGNAKKADLERAMKGHILAEAQLIALYGKKELVRR